MPFCKKYQANKLGSWKITDLLSYNKMKEDIIECIGDAPRVLYSLKTSLDDGSMTIVGYSIVPRRNKTSPNPTVPRCVSDPDKQA